MPIVDANDATLQTSTETKAVIDPKKRALGEKIAGLVSQGADRNTIMGFAVGADPTLRKDPKFGAWVDQAIKYREKALKEGHKSVKFGIDPGFYTTTIPLSDKGLISEKDMAKWSADPNRAGVAASADTATFGAMPDIVGAASALTGGDFSKARGDFKDRQNLLAYEHPEATLIGNLAGAATTGLASAPKSFPGLVASAGKQGGVYGFLSSDDPSLTGRLDQRHSFRRDKRCWGCCLGSGIARCRCGGPEGWQLLFSASSARPLKTSPMPTPCSRSRRTRPIRTFRR
jgi:hypothetical protein